MAEVERDGKKKSLKEPEIVVPLRRPYTQLGLGLVMFGFCAWFMAEQANTNDRGLIINGLIHLGPDGADIFYAVMALLSAGMSAGAAYAIYKYSRYASFEVVLGAKSMKIPVPAFRATGDGKIRYRDIRAVQLDPPAKPARLVIHHEDGSYGIPAMWMAGGQTLSWLADQIVDRMRKHAPEETRAA